MYDSSNPSNAVASLPDALAAANPGAAAAPMSAQQWSDGRTLQFPGTSSLCRVYNVKSDDPFKVRMKALTAASRPLRVAAQLPRSSSI
jgi:hypothetical protein